MPFNKWSWDYWISIYKRNPEPYPTPNTQTDSKWITDLKKLWTEMPREKRVNLWVRRCFVRYNTKSSTKHPKTKQIHWNSLRLKTVSKGTIKKVKRTQTKYLQMIPDKDISKIFLKSYNSVTTTKKNKNEQIWLDSFPKTKTQRCSTWAEKNKTKPQWDITTSPPGGYKSTAKTSAGEDVQQWTLICGWWECGMVRPLCQTLVVSQHVKQLQHDPAIPLQVKWKHTSPNLIQLCS